MNPLKRTRYFTFAVLFLWSGGVVANASVRSSDVDRLRRAQAHLQKGEFAEAVKIANRVFRASRADPTTSGDAAAVLIGGYRGLGKSEEAEKFLKQVDERSDASMLRRAGGQLVRYGHPRDAERLLTRSSSLNPSDTEIHAELGRLYSILDDRTKAAAAFERALERKPDSFWLRMELAKIYQLQGRPMDAANVYKNMQKEGGRDRAYYVLLGYSLSGLGEAREADQAFQKGTEIDPSDPVALHHLATQLEKGGRMKEAETAYKRSAELFEVWPSTGLEEMLLPLHHLGDLYLRQNRSREAEAIARRMEGLRTRLPSSVPWERVVIRPVQIYVKLGQLKKAEALCRSALSYQPHGRYDRLVLLIELARILEKQGRPPEASAAAMDAVRWLQEKPLELERKKEHLRMSDLLTETLESLGLNDPLETVAEDLIDRWEGYLDHSGFAKEVSAWAAGLQETKSSFKTPSSLPSPPEGRRDSPSSPSPWRGEGGGEGGKLDVFGATQLLDLFQTSTGLELAYFRPVVARLALSYEKRGKTTELVELVRRLEELAYSLLGDYRIKNREEFIGRLVELFPVLDSAGKRTEALLIQKWVPLIIIKLPDKGAVAAFLTQIGGLWEKQADNAAPDRLYRKALSLYNETARPEPKALLSTLENISRYYLARGFSDDAELVATYAVKWKDRLPDALDRQKLAELAIDVRRRSEATTSPPAR